MRNVTKKLLTTLISGGVLLNTIFPTSYFNVKNNIPYTYGYNVSVVNEYSAGNLNKQKQELVYSNKYTSTDDVSNIKNQELQNKINSTFLDVYLVADKKDNTFTLKYYNNGFGNISQKDKNEDPLSYFYENQVRSYVYLLMPKGVSFSDNNQKIYSKNNNDIQIQKAVPAEDSIGYQITCKINDILSIGEESDDSLDNKSFGDVLDSSVFGKKVKDKLEEYGLEDILGDKSAIFNLLLGIKSNSYSGLMKILEREVVNNLEYANYKDSPGIELLEKIPGKQGDYISLGIMLSASLSEIIEKNYRDSFLKDFGENYTISRVEMYCRDSIGYQIGREIEIKFTKNNKKYNDENIFVVVPSLSFQNIQNKSQSATLEDIVFSFKL